MNSRLEVGLGRFIASLIFGSWVYFFLLISGFSLILFIKIWSFNSQNNSGIKLVKFFLIIFYIIAYLICILHTILQNLSIIVPIVLALIGALWVLILYYGKDWDKKCIITQCVISLMVSFGIIYGGLIKCQIFSPVADIQRAKPRFYIGRVPDIDYPRSILSTPSADSPLKRKCALFANRFFGWPFR